MTDALAQARNALGLDVDCPACGAGISQPCRSSSGTVRVQVHKARTRPAAPVHVPVPVRWVQADLFTDDETA